ncbi:MAG: tRNA (adenosine(37)-N6)-threonylcarbamoyltransferase complex transferase subunit TsaD [SAR116 cluster bacterium MED-G04]|jgi:N6-L-threonylcarbamoyladenine synthase|nr:tRNA (adenosine(37)-N6)-threonylcarbamoyltransferase complex transferase subunit TsaD [SAR116 cluster bacterium]OUW37568.1 MAG: tRNA (adenosine(37)-N6)-threonylcarbamoyltransferase complex transferase subunit TsaD [Gammaproteobacteria bacterium TMED183]PDH65945.1 MAG: tRNA (adenosine(37)-N6)-threonylcarbamoyltransferase complex transferase subunit TsaD [SAR116 cluster bacterium MED-G04]CAI8421364.1 MAG: tRNA N6-adenosine threonylcarbamoyltransferase [SAR116 cluster bacterium MED-G04]HCV62516|tara:strand:- start:1527 stop:2681 length:1155 start_codon:yes stop_codon:yes gene_type:complete
MQLASLPPHAGIVAGRKRNNRVTDYILGIETSCDETAAAIVGSDGAIRANIVASQISEHQRHGGVVPEVAARAHLSQIGRVIDEAFATAGMDMTGISAVAATGGPGLIGGVLVGAVAAKAMAFGQGVPFYAINHLEGHALSARLTEGVEFPFLLLLVSGGHTQLLEVVSPGQYHRLGTTLDDAAGEAFDKSAKVMGLGMPGGPAIESAAAMGDDRAVTLPRPLAGKPGCHFSFSGMKTAVLTAWRGAIADLPEGHERQARIADLAASLQRAVGDSLAGQSAKAMAMFRERHPHQQQPGFVVAGGVAANRTIRSMLAQKADENGFGFFAPPPQLCTDNAAMIAWAAMERRNAGLPADGLDFEPRPRWPLDPEAAPPPGRNNRKGK